MRGDLLRFQDAAGAAEVHLQDGGGAAREDPGEFVLGRQPLAGGDRDRVARATCAISSGISGGTGSSNHSGS